MREREREGGNCKKKKVMRKFRKGVSERRERERERKGGTVKRRKS